MGAESDGPFVAATPDAALPGSRLARARKERVLRPKPEESPYFKKDVDEWVEVTRNLLLEFPVDITDVIDIVQTAWRSIFESSIGDFRIGQDIFLGPQAMGGLLHELIPLEFARRWPDAWRKDQTSAEKDLVCLSDAKFSAEIKTSSSGSQIFGNRSFAQEVEGGGKKSKSGYYLAINYDKFPADREPGHTYQPSLRMIRMGWLDSTDWAGQEKETGQQSNLAPVIEDNQLLIIYAE